MGALRRWLGAHYAPVVAAARQRGLPHAAPMSLAFAAAVTIVWVLGELPATKDAVDNLTHYRAQDLLDSRWWRLIPSALGVYNVGHLIFTFALVALVMIPLEARIGGGRMLALCMAGHLLPTLAAFAYLHSWSPQQLSELDFGTSAIGVCTAAALAVVRRSRFIAAVVVAGLLADLAYDAGLTSAEHSVAAAVGAIMALAFSARRS